MRSPRPLPASRLALGLALLAGALAAPARAAAPPQRYEVVHAFEPPLEGLTSLVSGSDGALYGVASVPERPGGVVYRVERDGSRLQRLHTFVGPDGSEPRFALREGSDGWLYGTTHRGGPAQVGVLYKVRRDGGGFVVLHEFEAADGTPTSGVLEAADGALYGTTDWGSGFPKGLLYRVQRDGSGFTRLHAFGGAGGEHPWAGLTEAADGSLRGVTDYGGARGSGVVYRVERDGTGFAVLHSFDSPMGLGKSPLVPGPDGALYGSTSAGGRCQQGTVYRLAGDEVARVHDLCRGEGIAPLGLTVGSDGLLYGVTARGGAHDGGLVFRLERDGSGYAVLRDIGLTHWFRWASVVEGPDGALYGALAGPESCSLRGALYRVGRDGTGFARLDLPVDGWLPTALAAASDGVLHGVAAGTACSGAAGFLYRLDPEAGDYSKMREFAGPDGARPTAAPTEGPDGWLYGTTDAGGAGDQGVVYRVARDGTGFATLHEFRGPDGSSPSAALVVGSDGFLYGTTDRGGSRGVGTVFRLARDGSAFLTLHEFSGPDGAYAVEASLREGADGALYGVTAYGGGWDQGVLYRLGRDGSGFALLHEFEPATGTVPRGGLLEGRGGILYGTAAAGGAFRRGVVYRVGRDGSGFATLHEFEGPDGAAPSTALVRGPGGTLYGTTVGGGAHDLGVVFRLGEDGGGFAIVHEFDGSGGAFPNGLVRLGGALYGTTSEGGQQERGVLFRLRVAPNSGSDFDRDGRSDLLWRNRETGTSALWLPRGDGSVESDELPAPPPPWTLAATGDLDGDGDPDLVWRHGATGESLAWTMDGTRPGRSDALPPVRSPGAVVGSGDLDGDGRSDLVWRDAAGRHFAWLMSGPAVTAAVRLPPPSPGRALAAVADLDGDGRSDLVWRDAAAGTVTAWLMDGATVTSVAELPPVAGWDVAGAGDLDGDGAEDLVWRERGTGVAAWLMAGARVRRGAALPSLDPTWSLAAVRDFDGDGRADLVWRQDGTGADAVWSMAGTRLTAGSFLPTVSGEGWEIR